jgi:hypothetical protein
MALHIMRGDAILRISSVMRVLEDGAAPVRESCSFDTTNQFGCLASEHWSDDKLDATHWCVHSDQ